MSTLLAGLLLGIVTVLLRAALKSYMRRMRVLKVQGEAPPALSEGLSRQGNAVVKEGQRAGSV